jgi:hypothetical protein
MRLRSARAFRLVDIMVLVAATAVAFALYRQGIVGGIPFTTLGFFWEPWLFYWMHQLVPFPAIWSLTVFGLISFDRATPRRRRFRDAGAVACCSAVVVLAITTLIGTAFYLIHVFEDYQFIPKVLSHGRNRHATPPFGNTPSEEFIGAAVLGAWAVMAAAGRWRVGRSWLDWMGFALGIAWIALFLLYLYGYTG